MRAFRPCTAALAVCVLWPAALAPRPAAAQAEAPTLDESAVTREQAIERIAPRTELDWQSLRELDAQDYVDRLAALDRLAVEASRLALERTPRERTTEVARGILAAHEAGRELARALLPQADPDAMTMQADIDARAALGADAPTIAFEEAYVNAMIEAHREAVGLTSYYRRFGGEEDVREFARRVLPLLEISLYRAVTIRLELVAEFAAAGSRDD